MNDDPKVEVDEDINDEKTVDDNVNEESRDFCARFVQPMEGNRGGRDQGCVDEKESRDACPAQAEAGQRMDHVRPGCAEDILQPALFDFFPLLLGVVQLIHAYSSL